ncbi:AAA family ATPase [Microbacterium sp.]|uniref:AAA family ATPase n=1 Tax=Microbacterium sp. TaxID=51671 RepID=UPI003A95B7DC
MDEVFIGRDATLAVLRDAWADAASARPRVVCLTGPAGIGKTSLARHFAAEFAADRLHWVSADESFLGSRMALLTRLVRELSPDSDGIPESADELQAGALTLRVLGESSQPYVLMIDDLQWADAESQNALRFALRRLEAEPVLVIIAIRAQAAASLDPPLRRLVTDPDLTECRLDGFTVVEIAELAQHLGTHLDPSTAERLRAHTDGLPLHTAALLAEHGGEGLHDAGRVLPAPRSLATIVDDRLHALAPPVQEFLTAGAVLGTTFSAPTAARMARSAGITTPVRAAVRAMLVDPVSGDEVAFRHPLVRAAIYNGLDPARRRALHHAAAACTAGIDSLMHRADAADGYDDALADELADVAATLTSGRTQADLLLASARCTSAPEQRDARTIAAAAALVEHGLIARAQSIRPAIEATQASITREVVLAALEIDDGRFAAARDRCDTALALAPTGDDAARAHATRALARWSEGDFTGAVDDAADALRGDIGAAAARCCYIRIVSLEVLGRLDELPDDHVPPTLGATDRLALDGVTRYHRNDIPGAIASLGEAVRRSRRGAPTSLFIIALGLLAESLYQEGHWDKAALHAELAVSLAHDTDAYGELLLSHASAAEIQAARGRFDAAAEHLAAVRRFATAMPTWPTMTRFGMTQAIVAIAQDDPAALREAAEILCAEPGRTIVGRRPAVPWHALIAEAQLRAGRPAEASESIAALRRGLGITRQARAVPDAARLTGMLAEAQGRPDDALAAYRLDDDAAAAAHSPLAVARLTMARGALQLRLGRVATGRATLTTARAAFAALGALPFLQRCEQLMDASDEASIAATPSLSPRQEAVALLIADGLTNREIARRLYVSVKAVEYHLGQIYARTGLSRRELGARMRESPTWHAEAV